MAKNFNNSSPFYTITVTINNALFFVLWSKFRITKQIVVTFVTTTLKALIPVSKTNDGISGRKFYACNIDNLFGNILAHISSHQHKKSAPTVISAQKRKFQSSPNKLYTDWAYYYTLSCTEFAFYQIHHKRVSTKRGISIPKREIHP